MQHGFVKIAAATPRLSLADPAANAAEACKCITQAADLGVKVLCFPALNLTGVTCGDLLLQEPLLTAAEQALCTGVSATAGKDLLCFVGLPVAEGDAVYAVTAAVYDGAVLGFVPEDDAPETLFWNGSEIPCDKDLLFCHSRLRDLRVGAYENEDATLICIPGANYEAAGSAEARRADLRAASLGGLCAILEANPGPGESSQDRVYAGHALVGELGEILTEQRWQSGLLVSEIDTQAIAQLRRRAETPAAASERVFWGKDLCDTALTRKVSTAPFLHGRDEADFCREILRLQAEGLRRRMDCTGTKKLIIGVSGGLDSTLALLVAATALDLSGRPREDLLAVTMPASAPLHAPAPTRKFCPSVWAPAS